MAKEWILNSAMNRFQLNFKRNVGAVSEEIRNCSPKTLEEWREYYFRQVRSRDHIEELGRKLYVKVTEVIAAEVVSVSEEDCIGYMVEMVIDRTFQGYQTEVETVYEILEREVGVKIEPAPDKWDRLFNIDFFIRVGERYIGLQIKPISSVSHIPQIMKERAIQAKTHKKFTSDFGGAVFYVFSVKQGRNKSIANPEVIEEIRSEISRLHNDAS